MLIFATILPGQPDDSYFREKETGDQEIEQSFFFFLFSFETAMSHYVDQVGLNCLLRFPSRVLGLEVCATKPSPMLSFSHMG